MYLFVALFCRLYCDAFGSNSRLSCQTTLYYILRVLDNVFSPVLPFLFDEMRSYLPEGVVFDHLRSFECASEWHQPKLAEVFELSRKIRSTIVSSTENTRHFGKPYDGFISATESQLNLLRVG